MTNDVTNSAARLSERRFRPGRIILGIVLGAIAYPAATATESHVALALVHALAALWLIATGCGWRPNLWWYAKLAFTLAALGLGALGVYVIAPHLSGGWRDLADVAGYVCFGAGGMAGLFTLGMPVGTANGGAGSSPVAASNESPRITPSIYTDPDYYWCEGNIYHFDTHSMLDD